MPRLQSEAPRISEKRKGELLLFQRISGLLFNDLNLLENALTHSSYAHESHPVQVSDNERLEFLGDSVLSLSVSEYLYRTYNMSEGEYTRIRSFVVSEDSLAEVAKRLTVDNYILIGRGEELSGGREKKAILADCMEAVFGAYFLDRGYDEAKRFILSLLIPSIERMKDDPMRKDYKTTLQEYVQKRFKTIPHYTMTGSEGPEHDQEFSFTVSFQKQVFGPCTGHSKKDAEQNAAKLALERLGLL